MSHSGEEISGERLAAELGVSRTAVWKAISQLRADGYDITAVTNRGYTLSGGDVFDAPSLSHALAEFMCAEDIARLTLDVRGEVTSTNTLLKAIASEGAPEGYILAATAQSAGRGRLGRKFYTSGMGIYVSILLRPSITAKSALSMTAAAAVAVTDAIYEVCGVKCGIKWVNDVFLAGRKICGILTEASLDMETGGLRDAIVGIGINLTKPDGGYPPELENVAGAIYESRDVMPSGIRARLCAAVAAHFMKYYKTLSDMSFMNAYRERSIIIGKHVAAVTPSSREDVEVLAITDDASLLVRRSDGTEKLLSSGEVSIRF